MAIQRGYLHYYYDNFLRSSSSPISALYTNKNKLLNMQLEEQSERTQSVVSQGDSEAQEILGYLLKNPSILQSAYKKIEGAGIEGSQDIAIDFQGYTTLRQLAQAIKKDKTVMTKFINEIDIFANKMEEILKIFSNLSEDPKQYQAIVNAALNSFEQHRSVSNMNSQDLTDRVVRRLARHQSGGDTLLKVPKGEDKLVTTSLQRAAVLIEGLKMPDAKKSLRSIADDEESSPLIARVVDKLFGLLINVYGGTGEHISSFGLGKTMNQINKKLLKEMYEFESSPMGANITRTTDLSLEFQEDAEILGMSLNDFFRQGKGDTRLTLLSSSDSLEKIQLSFGISEKQVRVDKNSNSKYISLVSNTPFFVAIKRSGLYDVSGFMTAFKNAAAGKSDDEVTPHPVALRDWSKAIEAVKYGSFLQHLAGVRAKEGDSHVNTLFLVVNHREVYSISSLIKKLKSDKIRLEMVPAMVNTRDRYEKINEWVPGEDTGELSQERSLRTSREVYQLWREQKVSMHLYL